MDKPLVMHAHHQCHLVLKISGSDSCTWVGDEFCRITDNAAVLINAWEPHRFEILGDNGRTTVLAMYIEPEWLAEIDPVFACSSHPEFFGQHSIPISKKVMDCAQMMSELMYFGASPSRSDVDGLVEEIMMSVIDRFSGWRSLQGAGGASSRYTDFRIRRAIDYMKSHIDEPLDICKLIDIATLSRSRFFQQFKNCTGVTPALFVNVQKVNTSIHELTAYQSPIQNIALDLNFLAQSNFSRFFHKHVGCSPSTYRRVASRVSN